MPDCADRPHLGCGQLLWNTEKDGLRMTSGHRRRSDNGDDFASNTHLAFNSEIITDNDLLLADFNNSTANGDEFSMWSRLQKVRFQGRRNTAGYRCIIA